MPETAPVPPPRRSVESKHAEVKNAQQFIEEFVNQSLLISNTDDIDSDDDDELNIS